MTFASDGLAHRIPKTCMVSQATSSLADTNRRLGKAHPSASSIATNTAGTTQAITSNEHQSSVARPACMPGSSAFDEALARLTLCGSITAIVSAVAKARENGHSDVDLRDLYIFYIV